MVGAWSNRGKIGETSYFARVWLEIGQNRENTLIGRALARIRAKLSKTLYVVGLWLKSGQITETNLFGRALVKIRVKTEEKHPFW